MRNPNIGEALTTVKPDKHGRTYWPHIPGMPSLRVHLPAEVSVRTLYQSWDGLEGLAMIQLYSPGCLSQLKSLPWVAGTVMVWCAGHWNLRHLYSASRIIASTDGYPRLALVVFNQRTRLMLYRSTFLSMSSKIPPGNGISLALDGIQSSTNVMSDTIPMSL